ncbi:MAG: hypothetical protein PWP48_1228 [Clostridiales bacterium]|nr:hypothetical protein [Clostridiales bacterium]
MCKESNYGIIYYEKVMELLKEIECSQMDNINKAAQVVKDSIAKGGVFHAFSTGHSHMIVEELFYRTGGLVPFNPIFDPATMLHEGAVKSTRIERLTGYAEAIFKSVDTRQDEPILIISNSGINPVPIEMAVLAKQRQMAVIAITSVNISSQQASRHVLNKKLMDVADIVIDNCIEKEDAAVEIDGTGQRVGALSSIAGIYIAQRIVLNVVEMFVAEDIVPPIFKSANLDGGDAHNGSLISKYKERIKGLC